MEYFRKLEIVYITENIRGLRKEAKSFDTQIKKNYNKTKILKNFKKTKI